MREKYKQNIGYLFKRTTTDNTPTYAVTGIPFYCNKVTKTRSVLNPISGVYKAVSSEGLKTTTQLDFAMNDRVSFVANPRNDANYNDFSIILQADDIPYNVKGNKYQSKEYKEYWLKLS